MSSDGQKNVSMAFRNQRFLGFDGRRATAFLMVPQLNRDAICRFLTAATAHRLFHPPRTPAHQASKDHVRGVRIRWLPPRRTEHRADSSGSLASAIKR